jgi:hypothetical protein
LRQNSAYLAMGSPIAKFATAASKTKKFASAILLTCSELRVSLSQRHCRVLCGEGTHDKNAQQVVKHARKPRLFSLAHHRVQPAPQEAIEARVLHSSLAFARIAASVSCHAASQAPCGQWEGEVE